MATGEIELTSFSASLGKRSMKRRDKGAGFLPFAQRWNVIWKMFSR